MASVWVLTNPAEASKQQVIRADLITRVGGDKEKVIASWTGLQIPVALVEWSTKFDNRDPLPPGFHIAFLKALDEAHREAKDGDKLLRGEWVIDQQEWQWVSEDVEDLDPKQF
jgi:hypothetical protein